MISAIKDGLRLITRLRKAIVILLCPYVQMRQCVRVLQLRRKVHKGFPIRVAFLSMYATDNQDLKIYELMRAEPDFFDPYFIVNPDVARSEENRNYNYNRTKRELASNYGTDRVLDGFVDGHAVDYTSQFDIMTTNNPYEAMAAREFKVLHWVLSGVPVFYTSYFYMGRCRTSVENLKMPVFSMFWRFFAENPYVLSLADKYQIINGRNCVLSGSTKMDDYSQVTPVKHDRKRIILAPHHSIGNVNPKGGGFLGYADDMLKLIRNYKDIDFVFRPHPLLYDNLKSSEYWGPDKTKSYWNALRTESNVVFSTTGDYLQEFADSDALMHDCGSFSAEYLFTGKPCAYFYRKDLAMDTLFTDLGRGCLASHYPIHRYQDMANFVEDVVINGNDKKKKDRSTFAHSNLMYNYPHASEYVVSYIKKKICGGQK